MNKLYEALKELVNNNSTVSVASEILDVNDMEEAIINELKSRGFNIEEA